MRGMVKARDRDRVLLSVDTILCGCIAKVYEDNISFSSLLTRINII